MFVDEVSFADVGSTWKFLPDERCSCNFSFFGNRKIQVILTRFFIIKYRTSLSLTVSGVLNLNQKKSSLDIKSLRSFRLLQVAARAQPCPRNDGTLGKHDQLLLPFLLTWYHHRRPSGRLFMRIIFAKVRNALEYSRKLFHHFQPHWLLNWEYTFLLFLFYFRLLVRCGIV